MPKDEFDFDDPLELNGVALPTHEDTTDAMCECFIEEFLRMGYNAKQILALFRNPHYLGMNLVMQKRGEEFVRGAIAESFARWGRPVTWPTPGGDVPGNSAPYEPGEPLSPTAAQREFDPGATDPMGAAIPKLKI